MSMQGPQRQTAHFMLKPFVNQVGSGNRFEFVNENRRVSRFLLQFLETGDMVTMPGLPRIPAAEAIDLDDNGQIKGLF